MVPVSKVICDLVLRVIALRTINSNLDETRELTVNNKCTATSLRKHVCQ